MLKINLSDQDGKRKPDREEAPPEVTDDTAVIDEPEEPTVSDEKKASRRKVSPLLIAAFVLIVIAVVAYLNRGVLLSLLPEKAEPVQSVRTPMPEPEPVTEAVEPSEPEPDPTFVLLNTISDVIPPRVWLTEVVLRYDGTYTIRGMSFAHEAMSVLNEGLTTIGLVTDSYFPRKTDSAETIYRFSVSGKVTDFVVPEILDMIPSGNLVSFSAPVIELSADMGVKFTETPESGKTYGENDMPFELQGSFVGLKQVIGTFCGSDTDIRVYQLVIIPDAVGLPFDKVNASFSLRIQSSI